MPEHPFEECEVLGNYEFLKAHMRELTLLWKRLRMMIKRHTEKKEAAAKQKKRLHALQALPPPPPQQSESTDDDNSTLGGNSLQGSLALLSLTDNPDFQ